jgi:thymidylate kinase
VTSLVLPTMTFESTTQTFSMTSPMYIILEAPDRVGKDTQIGLIIKELPDRVFHKMHYSALPFRDPAKHIAHSSAQYEQMFEIMKGLKPTGINVIFNRSHLGESVYAPLYRGYSGDYVFDIEQRHIQDLRDNVYLITMVNSPDILITRDDGQSLYSNRDELVAEIDGFVRAHRKSQIKNKLLLDVGTMEPAEVAAIIKQFLTEAHAASTGVTSE